MREFANWLIFNRLTPFLTYNNNKFRYFSFFVL